MLSALSVPRARTARRRHLRRDRVVRCDDFRADALGESPGAIRVDVAHENASAGAFRQLLIGESLPDAADSLDEDRAPGELVRSEDVPHARGSKRRGRCTGRDRPSLLARCCGRRRTECARR